MRLDRVGSISQVICHELHVYLASALKASSYVQLIRPAAVVTIATLKVTLMIIVYDGDRPR